MFRSWFRDHTGVERRDEVFRSRFRDPTGVDSTFIIGGVGSTSSLVLALHRWQTMIPNGLEEGEHPLHLFAWRDTLLTEKCLQSAPTFQTQDIHPSSTFLNQRDGPSSLRSTLARTLTRYIADGEVLAFSTYVTWRRAVNHTQDLHFPTFQPYLSKPVDSTASKPPLTRTDGLMARHENGRAEGIHNSLFIKEVLMNFPEAPFPETINYVEKEWSPTYLEVRDTTCL